MFDGVRREFKRDFKLFFYEICLVAKEDDGERINIVVVVVVVVIVVIVVSSPFPEREGKSG